MLNTILSTDSYKFSHWLQLPKNTKYTSSYIESRGLSSKFPENTEVVHFGLQMFLPKLTERIVKSEVEYANELALAHGLPFNRQGWLDLSDLGYLPIEIEALPEGTPVPFGTAQVQIRNTDDRFFWLTSYLETALLRSVWYPSTVSTLSREIKKIIYEYLVKTTDNPDNLINFKLQDFGCRGVSSLETAMIGGMAHLVNFMGTDTVPALIAARKYYEADMAAFSIPAAEHATITAWGADGEEDAYRNMLKQFAKPGALLSVVSDSYDIYNACANIWGGSLKEQVLESGAILVIRPDSGDPVETTLKVIEILGEKFGYTLNTKGFKVLHSAVRIIQGDGINISSVKDILDNYTNNGWSAENITFGLGGGLLQQVDRDSLKYAMKANAIDFGEGWRPIFKNPVTDSVKKSKPGRLAVVKENEKYLTIPEEELNGRRNQLTPVFHNGNILETWNLDQVRNNAKL